MRKLVTRCAGGRLGSNNYLESYANEQISTERVDYTSIVGNADPEIVMTTKETTEMNNQTDKELHSISKMVRVRQ
jgi:hypothetical protein